MKKGNVLFLGNSGVGKTTLINSILGTDAATGIGVSGTTKETKTYENDEVPFRIIDTMGFEPVKFMQPNKAIDGVKKWSKEAALDNNEDTNIDLICLCVDGTSSKLFSKTIDDFLKSISLWKTVPIIVVITKSYSLPDREENVKMVEKAFEGKKREVRGIYPVVAASYVIRDDYAVEPQGIEELVVAINSLLPEGIKAATSDIEKYKLDRKRFLAQSTVFGATGIGVAVGLAPIPFADAALLVPTETLEINGISRIYEVKNDDRYKTLLNQMIEVGTVSLVAKTIISALKAIPGVNIAASILNGVIAGVIVAAIGEGSIYVFEQIYLGNKTVEDIDWVTKVLEGKLSNELVKKVSAIVDSLPENATKKDILEAISKLFKK
ncbi:MAG: GTP-binding DUF697 domain-containing protein [Saccharofermentans sp.]|nr:GTP-binding DUF697 domain-containing protein [Saccharofermentans sp.]